MGHKTETKPILELVLTGSNFDICRYDYFDMTYDILQVHKDLPTE